MRMTKLRVTDTKVLHRACDEHSWCKENMVRIDS